jgi:hypothetical protein
MTPWTFNIKFPRGTEFTFGSLTFAAGEDRDLRMLPPGEAAEHIAPSSASSETQAESDLFDGSYVRTVKLIRGIPVVTTILRPCVGAVSSSKIGPILRSRVIRKLSRDRGQHLRKLREHQPPHLYGGPKGRSALPQLQRVSHHREV